ncbi:MAG: DUF424 family protein [Candidatus Pacearchaeota archaeon]|jgi:hypothetical protein
MVYLNVIKSYRDVVAVCDSSILGKKFEQGKFQLDVKESFYKGKEVSAEHAERIMKDLAKEDATFNIAGQESVDAAIKAGIITKENVGKIQGIPYALVLL